MLVALKSFALCVLPISTCSHLSCCLYRGWSTDVPLRVRDMGEGDCCSGRACQNMPPPLDQDLPKHRKRGRRTGQDPVSLSVLSQRCRGFMGGEEEGHVILQQLLH